MPAFVRTGGRGDADKGKASRTLSPPTPPPLWPRRRTGPSSPTSGDRQSRARYILVVVRSASRGCTGRGGGHGPQKLNPELQAWQPVAGSAPAPPPRKHHPRKGLHPPPCMGRGKECPLAAGCLATLTGHRVHTKPAELGLCPRAQGQVCRDWRPYLRHGALQQQAVGKVAATGLLPPGWASWVAVGAGSQAGHLPTLCPALGSASSSIWGQKFGVLLPCGALCPLGIRRYHHGAGP